MIDADRASDRRSSIRRTHQPFTITRTCTINDHDHLHLHDQRSTRGQASAASIDIHAVTGARAARQVLLGGPSRTKPRAPPPPGPPSRTSRARVRLGTNLRAPADQLRTFLPLADQRRDSSPPGEGTNHCARQPGAGFIRASGVSIGLRVKVAARATRRGHIRVDQNVCAGCGRSVGAPASISATFRGEHRPFASKVAARATWRGQIRVDQNVWPKCGRSS
jgi:hypothetical protein